MRSPILVLTFYLTCGSVMQVSRLAMLSLLAVFKDILPGYRIRLPTDKELEIAVSKEVKQTRDFESMQLRLYQVRDSFATHSHCCNERLHVQYFRRSPASLCCWRNAREPLAEMVSEAVLYICAISCTCACLTSQPSPCSQEPAPDGSCHMQCGTVWF